MKLINLLKELVTNMEIICDNCGWRWKIKDGGDDLYICHKCGHDNNPEKLQEEKDDFKPSNLAYLGNLHDQ